MQRGWLALTVAALLSGCSAAIPTPAANQPGAESSRTPSPAGPSPTPVPGDQLPGVQISARYSGAAPDLAAYNSSTLRTIVVSGDVIPARLVNHAAVRTGDYSWPWRATADILRAGDITFINLEASLTPLCPDITTGFTLCGNSGFMGPLTAAGTNLVVNIANNHMSNLGTGALNETVDSLAAHGALAAGVGRIALRTIRGLRFAFVGFNAVGAAVDRAAMKETIATARGEADVVVAQFHWGLEYVTSPLPAPGIAPDDPRVIGRLAVDDGADLVIGNHPHCVQGAEFYKGHLIAYAHGNFVFDQDWSVGTQEGAIGRYVFSGKQLVGVSYVPVRIGKNGQPAPLDPATGEGRQILDRMARSSHELLGQAKAILPVDAKGLDSCP